MIGYAFCGSFCTISDSLRQLTTLVERGLDVVPIMSERVWSTDTRFFAAEELRRRVKGITGREIVHTVEGAEPFGPKPLDALIIAPCTGNTLAKLALGITDTSVTMAAKAHMRNNRPLLIAPATNDGLGASGKNIMALMNYKNIFFVPFGEDDPQKKPKSLVCRFDLLKEAACSALDFVQLQPVIL